MEFDVFVIWMTVSRVPSAITLGNTRIDALFSVVTWACAPLTARPTRAAAISPTRPRCLRISLLLFGHGRLAAPPCRTALPLGWLRQIDEITLGPAPLEVQALA